jgi:hypothetical protein
MALEIAVVVRFYLDCQKFYNILGMNITKSFDGAFKRMHDRNWEKIYVLVDIHDTVFEACYHNKEEYKWFPYAKEALEIMSYSQRISLILWTSTHKEDIDRYLKVFKENGIKFDMVNINHETKNTDLSNFDEKTYFNVGIDDKFGFDAETDWEVVYNYLVEAIRLGKFK